MRKLVLISLLSFCMSAVHAIDVRDMFVAMPDSVLPLLSGINRLDMLDFRDSGMKSVVRNRLEGYSELIDIGSNSMRIRYTGNSEVTIRLYYYKDAVPVVCLLHTVTSGGLSDSRISFYDSKWKKLDDQRLLRIPTIDDFIRDGLCKDSVGYVKRMCPVNSIKAYLPDSRDRIEFEYTGLSFTGEDSLRCASCIKPDPLVYEWNGKRFTPLKDRK